MSPPHFALPSGDGWQMQYRRMIRNRLKLDVAYSSSEDYDDAVYHFFQDAWSLKDWIKCDPAVPAEVQGRVESAALAQLPLRIAADVANGSKHFSLNTTREGTRIVERSHS